MIYDCFTFFNELDLLELRLHTLDGIVDRFVLVEATRTHQGRPKPLHFKENLSRFSRFSDKIIHVVVDDYPETENEEAWTLERYQRDCILRGLKGCSADDRILISDVDEIPDPDILSKFIDEKHPVIFRQRMYYYYFNCINDSHGSSYRWYGTVMVPFRLLGRPQEFRELSIKMMGLEHAGLAGRIYLLLWKFLHVDLKGRSVVLADDAGWHFSYLGGTAAIIKKIEAFAHTEYNKPEFKDPDKIEERMKEGKDILGRGFTYSFVELDATFPAYLLNNREKFSHLISNRHE